MESVFRFRVALLASLLEASNLGSLDGDHNRFLSWDNGLILACILNLVEDTAYRHMGEMVML